MTLEKEKAAQIGESGTAFSSATYINKLTSNCDNLQGHISIYEGDANHV